MGVCWGREVERLRFLGGEPILPRSLEETGRFEVRSNRLPLRSRSWEVVAQACLFLLHMEKDFLTLGPARATAQLLGGLGRVFLPQGVRDDVTSGRLLGDSDS